MHFLQRAPPLWPPPPTDQVFSAIVSAMETSVTSTFTVGRKLDMTTFSARKGKFGNDGHSFFMRIHEPRTSARVFDSGDVIVRGAKNEKESRLAARKFAKIIQNAGFPDVKFREFKVCSFIGTYRTDFAICIEDLANDQEGAEFYSDDKGPPWTMFCLPSSTVLNSVFGEGKVRVTGAKTAHELQEAFEQVRPLVERFAAERTT